MFTGLIEEVGVIERVIASGNGKNFVIRAHAVLEKTAVGDSISVNGVCLTVTEVERCSFTAFASTVTCGLTTLGTAASGTKANLERALALGSRLGGHIVQGHVDGVGTVKSVDRDSRGVSIRIEAGAEIARYIVERGSISVDGISLTVVSLDGRAFGLYLIPETIAATTLAEKKAGDRVNIETDILARYVERMIQGVRDGKGDGEAALKRALAEEGYL